jgi:hypothetical protein
MFRLHTESPVFMLVPSSRRVLACHGKLRLVTGLLVQFLVQFAPPVA